ncbi:MAG: Na/Pi cotransporter family protein [Syntrophomonadaceae bacterium]|nr:Na/Pi cotransporter family protein [Syntrophomonadaceae bacterium]
MSIQDVLFAFVGGLALFLFGLRFMSDALQAAAGDRMRVILEKGTKNPVRGVLTGTLVTALIQSSSATTVLTVGLVNAQLLTLRQAIGVIMGANIGTTITAYLIGFNLQDYVFPIIAIGAVTFMFAKNKRNQSIGQAILGFGILFFGLTIMGDGMKPLKDLAFFTDFMVSVENNPILGVLIGAVFTFIVQSSSATIGVLQELANQGAVTYAQAVPILFGDNIGTTVTALLAAIGASVAARRTALTHFIFNVVGTLIFLPLFMVGLFPKLVIFVTNSLFTILPGFIGSWDSLNIKLQIAQTHAVFNISNTLIHLPLVAVLAWIVTKLIPDSEVEQELTEYRTKFIDKRFLRNPSVALAQANRETMRMGSLAHQAFNNAILFFNTRDSDYVGSSIVIEDTIDMLEREITDYVIAASEKRLSKEDSNLSVTILQALNDIERIGDLSESIIEMANYASKHQVEFSGEAKKEIERLIAITDETLALTFLTFDTKDITIAKKVEQNERLVDKLQAEYRRNHIMRLNERVCNGNNGAVFLDLIGALERISDHCRNIASYSIGEGYMYN